MSQLQRSEKLTALWLDGEATPDEERALERVVANDTAMASAALGLTEVEVGLRGAVVIDLEQRIMERVRAAGSGPDDDGGGPSAGAPSEGSPGPTGGAASGPQASAQPPVEQLIAGRYRILQELGRGGNAVTYRVLDLAQREEVALKELSLRRAGNWKALELFEREAQVLASLDHPLIPRYVRHFDVEVEGDRRFYIVQRLAPGLSLEELRQRGQLFGERELHAVATDVLRALIYLHELQQPVMHRDITPGNVLRDASGSARLVDFGAVTKADLDPELGGSTVVGSYGYMPPEQLRGVAGPPSDLYALGATLLYALTGSPPAAFPQKRLKIEFGPHVTLSRRMKRWLARLLEPAMEDRYQSARAALRALPSRRTAGEP